jgi:hypothetical protein
MDIPVSFIWIIISFDAVFKYGDGVKFWGYVVTNAEQLCVEFCNFVQCHIFVNYLTFSVNKWNIKKYNKIAISRNTTVIIIIITVMGLDDFMYFV